MIINEAFDTDMPVTRNTYPPRALGLEGRPGGQGLALETANVWKKNSRAKLRGLETAP